MGATFYSLSMAMPSDAREIARGLRRRDPDLLDHLIEHYHYRLFRYLFLLTGNKETADDLFQETWIRVLERGSQYKTQWRFGTWLFTIARNLYIDLLRKKDPMASRGSEEEHKVLVTDSLLAAPEPSPFEVHSRREESARVARLLQSLPSFYREVLVLRFQEDLDLAEIAQVTAAPLSTVKARLYRGLDALRELLKSEEEERI